MDYADIRNSVRYRGGEIAMKIIFDSENEKQEFLKWACLGDINLEANAHCGETDSCKECWEHCSKFVELEVKGEVRKCVGSIESITE